MTAKGITQPNVAPPKKPEPTPQELATAVIAISDAMQKLMASGLNRRAIEVLVQHLSHAPMSQVRAVLNSLTELRHAYTNR